MHSSDKTDLSTFLVCNRSTASDELSSIYQNKLTGLNFAVFKSDLNSFSPIPASINSLLLSQKYWLQVENKAALVFSALEKTARWIAKPEQNRIAERIYCSLTQLERDAAFGLLEAHSGSAAIRYDLFLTPTAAKILEVNATIPAMQAYSDMICEAHSEVFQSNQNSAKVSNTDQLLKSLLAHYSRSGGQKVEKIAIVARRGDSQLAELLYFKRKWTEQGFVVEIVQPSDLQIEGEKLRDERNVYDLIYRHIFVTGIDIKSDFYKALRKSRSFKIFNPISGHLEVKGLLAELSWLASDSKRAEDAGISIAEVAAVEEMVPCTRLLDRCRFSSAAEIDLIVANRDRLVLKKSNGYGGHGVILGKDFDLPNVQAQVATIMGRTGTLEFSEFVRFCIESANDAWIIQDLVDGIAFANQVLANGSVSDLTTFVDLSLFGNSGTDYRPAGAAARIGPHQIVNIGRGGGMMPVCYSQ